MRMQVHNTFRDLEESNILRPYMSDAIKDISKACLAFEVKESAPQIAGILILTKVAAIWVSSKMQMIWLFYATVIAIRQLRSEITKVYVLRLCSWMRVSTEEISKEETWIPVSIIDRNKSPYAISYLPLAFRAVISSAMDQISL